MCGRYASSRPPEDVAEAFGIRPDDVDGVLEPDFNVAPTDPVYAVAERATDDGVVRRLRVARWGLVPSWAKDSTIGSRLINARVETVAEKPAFRRAFAARRCLLPADGYYEWYGEQKGHKQPFFIRPRDGGLLAMAGLYEWWKGPDGEWLLTTAVVTTSATDELGHLHDRMPMLVEPASWAAWLDPATDDGATLLGLLVPAAPGLLEAFPVSAAVGDVRNNGPELVEPLPPES